MKTRSIKSTCGKLAVLALAASTAIPMVANAEEPDAFVEYVESTSAGKQYIDTGVIGKCGTKAEMKLLWAATGDTVFLGTLAASNGDTRFLLCAKSARSPANAISGGHRTYTKGTVTYSSETPDHIVSSITHDGTSVSISIVANDTVSVDEMREEAALDTERNMYMFARHEADNTVKYHAVTRCYSTKIWQLDGNGDWELKRDYRPCVKNERAGLYDTVSGDIFYSLGTSDFVAGPYVKLHGKPDHFIQYVEATGTQYIDTEVVGRCNSAMEAHVMWSWVNDASFLGSRIDGGNTRFMLYGAAGRHWMAHRTYTAGTDSTAKGSVSGSPKVEWNLTAPDYISSSISTNGANVTYWMKVNGTTRINQTRTEEGINTGLNMYLFAQNLGGSPTFHSPVRCFDLKITQDGTLVRDFRPCIKDGRAGLYDEVSGWIFFPQGGELVYPNETPDKYVRWANATGSSYVPVAVRAKSGVKAEMKYRPMDDSKEDQYFLAARKGNERFLLNYLYLYSTTVINTIGYRNNYKAVQSTWQKGEDYTLLSEIDHTGAVSGTRNGETGSAASLGLLDTGLNLNMFAINMDGKAQDYYTGRFYYTKIWEWDATAGEYRIVRDLKPCVKDGNVMFYDVESHTMFKPYPAISAEGNVGKTGFIVVIK